MNLLCLGAALIGIACAQAQPPRILCVDGHPARRSSDVTYGGLPSRHNAQRDHVVPLELGGPDTPSNVHYQRCDETGEHGRCLAGPAKLKDDDEHLAGEKMCHDEAAAEKCRAAGEKVCPVTWTLDYAREWLAARWPVDAAHGY